MRDLIDRALALHRAGRPAEAEPLYRQVLAADPGNAEVLHLMGVLAIQSGRFAEATDWIGRALAARADFAEAHNNLGNAQRALGRLDLAVQCYDRALALKPDFPEALNNRGMACLAAGDAAGAADVTARALALRPAYPEAAINHAVALQHLGRIPEAATAFALACRLVPGNADLHNTLGNLLHSLGRWTEAEAAFAEAAGLRPDFAEFHVNRGTALTEGRRLTAAAQAFRRALDLAPGHPRALAGLGIALMLAGEAGEAASCLGQVAEMMPDQPSVHANLGLAQAKLGRLAEAEASQRRALALRPDYALAQNNLAAVLVEQGRPAEALDIIEDVIGRDPRLAEAHIARGNALKTLGRLDEAGAALRDALALKPDIAEAHTALGSVLFGRWRLDEAEASHRRALDLWPDFAAAMINLGMVMQMQGRPGEALALYDRAAELTRGDALALALGAMMNAACYDETLDHRALERIGRRFGQTMARPPLETPALVRPTVADADRRLRIGYLSSDLRNHPVATNLLPVLEHHDRAAFDLHFYAHVARPDSYTDRFKALAAGWHDIHALSDREAAQRIRADGIDILVSLAGRFDQNRPQICAGRAAPVQMSLYEVGTSGLDEMDYLIGDPVLMPRHTDEWFSERRVRLPCYYVAHPPAGLDRLPVPDRQGPPVFACFNNPSKIAPGIATQWGRLLAAIPDARLLLKFHQVYGPGSLRDRLSGLLTGAGARPDQVEFLDGDEGAQAFLGLYDRADFALDPRPFSGSTTTFQSLSMGVPVLTLPGPAMVTRWTASMLRRVGLEELIATDEDDFVWRGCRLAEQVAQWRAGRATLRQRVIDSSLCDVRRWSRNLERLYRAVWRRRCRGAG